MRKNLMRLAAFIVITACLAMQGAPSASSAVKEFSDVQNHWGKPFIEALTAKGGISGFEDGLFHPDDPVTLKQYVTIVIGSTCGAQKPINGDWASGYMALALEKDVITESDYTVQDDPINRLAAGRIGRMSLLNILGEDDLADTTASNELTDLGACNECITHISQMYAKGIVTGRPGKIYDGESIITRAESCVIIMKMLEPGLRVPPEPQETIVLLDPKIALEIMETEKTVKVVDVRTLEEHNTGYIPGSVSIPLDQLSRQSAELLPDKNMIIIVYCQKGSRSEQVYKLLIGLGYPNVFTIGGIDNWPYEIQKA